MLTLVDEAIRSDPALAGAVERASWLIASELGRSAGRAAVDWKRGRDAQGLPRVKLTLTDRESDVSRSDEFAPAALDDEVRFSSRVNWHWDSVLQADIEKRLARIHEALQTIEDD